MSQPQRVLVAGATGYIGQRVVQALVARGHEVVCLARRRAGVDGRLDEDATRRSLSGATVCFAEVTDPAALAEALHGRRLDAVVSCLASRSGSPRDAWAIDHAANLALLGAAKAAGANHFVLLSAICVQKPKLAFQHAKLAFEAALQASGLSWSIVRPTAFFKSLSGQVARVKAGKPMLLFGDGQLTACTPISEADLARFIADCLEDPLKKDRVLPVGGPGPALTPLQQGELLFAAADRTPRYRHVPVRLMDAIIFVLGTLGRVFPKLADTAEYARIGRYYATESMLVLDERTGSYDAAQTPRFGEDTLAAFYARVVKEGLSGQELGEHSLSGPSRGVDR